MVKWSKLLKGDPDEARRARDEMESLLPTRSEETLRPAIPAKDVTTIALRLKHQIETVIPCEIDEAKVTAAHGYVITPAVVKCAKSAGGDEYKACVVFSLLVVSKWFKRLAAIELWDADMHAVRATACEVIAKQIIEEEEDQRYLLEEVLLKRYAIVVDGEETFPINAIEKASDQHALTVIGSSGFQKCLTHLWKGWLITDPSDPSRFVEYKHKANTSYWAHFDPDRMRVPQYQNTLEIAFSLVYLALYTIAINTINRTGDLDVVEALLYIQSAGYIFDTIAHVYKAGTSYLAFWNIFNVSLYTLLIVSFTTRMIALGHPLDSDTRTRFNEISYNFLAVTAPMFWARLLLYLNSFRAFGTMLVIVAAMMRESLIFFALLSVVYVGFFQAFYGLSQVENPGTAVAPIMMYMVQALLQAPEFEGFHLYSPPFGIILYCVFTFIVMVILLNILIALYNSSYAEIHDSRSDEEYMALYARQTIQYVRAIDEYVYIAPFTLIEVFGLILPFEWWMSKERYARLNHTVMGIVYSPMLLLTAMWETKQAHIVIANRRRGAQADDTIEEWEDDECDLDVDDWKSRVAKAKPNLQDNPVQECKELRKEVQELKEMMKALLQHRGVHQKEDPMESSSSTAGYPTPRDD